LLAAIGKNRDDPFEEINAGIGIDSVDQDWLRHNQRTLG
jgi:hypothetical protein